MAQKHGMNMAFSIHKVTCHEDAKEGEKAPLRLCYPATRQKSVV